MELNYKQFGQGDPVIILHGLFGTLDNWQTIAKALAAHFTVFIVDQRNHGRSPHTDTHGYPEMAQDLAHFMESHWIYKTHIIGHSMGGKTAMSFALEHADLLDKLVVVDIGPKAYKGGHRTIFEALLALEPSQVKSRQEADEHLAKWIPEYSTRQFLLKNLSRQPEGGYRWKMNLPVIHQHYADILSAIEADEPYSGESLFIRGGKSDYIAPEGQPEIQALFPGAALQTVADAGHWIHADQPKELLDIVVPFLLDA